MSNQEQIKKQLNEQLDVFLNTKYAGKVAPPENIIELFETAIMVLPPFAHQLNFYKVKAIATTKYEDLTNGNLNDVVKVILNTPLEKLYKDNDLSFSMNRVVDKKYTIDQADELVNEMNMILDCSMQKGIIVKDSDKFLSIIDKCIAMDKFVLAYNAHVESFQKSLQAKKVMLESLSSPRTNGMRIIPQA